MDNKLQQLTQKLYEEGLEKGRRQAEQMIEEARSQAAKIVADAETKAAKILGDASQKAEETAKNSRTELALASRQTVTSLKEMIETLVEAKTLDAPVAGLSMDAQFVGSMLMEIAKNWQGAAGGKTDLVALLPEAMRAKFDSALKASLGKALGEGLELRYSNGVKSGFKIGPRAGGYYISFTDEDFKALLCSFLRPKVTELLYGGE